MRLRVPTLLSHKSKHKWAWVLCVHVGCQVADPEKYHFRPKEMLVQVVETVLNLAPHDEFITAVVESDLVNEESTWCRGCVAMPVVLWPKQTGARCPAFLLSDRSLTLWWLW